MPLPNSDHVTTLVVAARSGDREAKDDLFRLIYDELRAIAHRTPLVGRDGETMQPTVLANEAYLQFVRRIPPPPADEPDSRAAFFRTVALAMRTILRDHWRKKTARKRGGHEQPIALGAIDPTAVLERSFATTDFLALDEAMDKLERYNPRWFDVVMHKCFAGRGNEETSALMGVGVTSIKKDWRLARAWLKREIEGAAPDEARE